MGDQSQEDKQCAYKGGVVPLLGVQSARSITGLLSLLCGLRLGKGHSLGACTIAGRAQAGNCRCLCGGGALGCRGLVVGHPGSSAQDRPGQHQQERHQGQVRCGGRAAHASRFFRAAMLRTVVFSQPCPLSLLVNTQVQERSCLWCWIVVQVDEWQCWAGLRHGYRRRAAPNDTKPGTGRLHSD